MKMMYLTITTLTFLLLIIAIFAKKSPQLNFPDSYKLSENITPEQQKKISQQAILYLEKLITFPSTEGNEKGISQFIIRTLKQEGIKVETIRYPNNPDKISIFAIYNPQGYANRGLLLSGHYDIVSASKNEWEFDPFSGYNDGKFVYGRGAMDMKGLLAVQMAIFVDLFKNKRELNIPVMFLAVPDEETGSDYGMQYFLKEKPDLVNLIQYAINEGGYGTKNMVVPNSKFLNIQYAGKSLVWLDGVAKGDSGHSSTPPVNTAYANLNKFVNELESDFDNTYISRETSIFFRQISKRFPFPNALLLSRTNSRLVQKIIGSRIKRNTFLRAMTSNTLSITGLNVTENEYYNELPSEIGFHLDIRLLPDQDLEIFLSKLNSVAKKYNIEYEIVKKSQSKSSDINSELFHAIGLAGISNIKDVIITPYLSPGDSDCTYLRRQGIQCFGIYPGLFEEDEISGIHGINEKVRISNIELSVSILSDTIKILSNNIRNYNEQ